MRGVALACFAWAFLAPEPGAAQVTPAYQGPITPSVHQPDVFPPNDDSFSQVMRTRRNHLAQERYDRLKSGSDRLHMMCVQLQANLSAHGVPDEADRKLMAEIEKQTKTLRNLMVQ